MYRYKPTEVLDVMSSMLKHVLVPPTAVAYVLL